MALEDGAGPLDLCISLALYWPTYQKVYKTTKPDLTAVSWL